MKKYIPSEIEPKWQERWKEDKLYSPDLDKAKNPYYALMMFPYPSAEGLHVGNMYAFTGVDITGRFNRMLGKDVFEPIGLDGFGIHTENYALKINQHPMKLSEITEKRFYEQLTMIGNGYDWTRTIETYKPGYYKWTQWLFLQMFKKGLAYKKNAKVNWCPSCLTVLADEQVISGECERCDSVVIQKELKQWFFKITEYAERLLGNLNHIDWSEKVKVAQRNWIGRSEGVLLNFDEIEVFTTRPDTLFGVTAVIISPEHPLLAKFTMPENKKKVEQYIKDSAKKSELERKEQKDKTGVFTGSRVKNPINGEDLPVWVADYVLASYGTGAIMVVPAHDQRDFEFAVKFNLPIKVVIEPVMGQKLDNEQQRKSIIAIVLDSKNKKYLTINWGKELGGYLFIGGGVEEGEELVDTVKREVKEETGYKNLKFIAQTEKIHHHYRAFSKNINREIEVTGLLFELENKEKDDLDLHSDEKKRIGIEWLTKEDVRSKIEDESHFYAFNRLVNGLIYGEEGLMVESGQFNGLSSSQAREKISDYLEKHHLGQLQKQYHLRDWLISRQRYWGPPIPIIYCDKCGVVPVPEEDLPVELPFVEDFRPKGTGESPLASNPSFFNVKCPNCGGSARRETDVSDTFLDSAWYFFRYISTEFNDVAFDKDRVKKWLPVDVYIGGAEHSVLHLLYARFITMVLKDLGYIEFEEPFSKFIAHGLIIKDGVKMSKSKGNVVNPDDVIKKFGADMFRTYLMFLGPYTDGGDFSDSGMNGIRRFLERVWVLKDKIKDLEFDLKIMYGVVKKVTENIEQVKFNTSIAFLMEWVNYLTKKDSISKEEYKTLLLLLAPFAPHITEELWSHFAPQGSRDKNWSIHQQSWPKFDNKYLEEKEVAVVVQINGKIRDIILIQKDMESNEEAVEKMAKESEKVIKFLDGKTVKKVIYVPGKVVNLVV